MHIGICGGIDCIEKFQAMGFDYLEAGAAPIASLSDEEFEVQKAMAEKGSIECEAFNCFFPWDIKIVGPDVNEKSVLEHVKKVLERVAALNGKITVIGSGGARAVPEGWDKDKGIEQFASVLRMIGDEASKYGITAVVEPLHKKETNLVNTVLEGIELVNMVNHPNVKLLADFYHMRIESEGMESIIKAGALLRHIHIANSNGRVYPKDVPEDEYAAFFQALKAIGYDGRVSIEASTDDVDTDAPVALKVLQGLAL